MLNSKMIARGPVFVPAVNHDGSKLVWSNRTDDHRDLFAYEDGQTVRLTNDAEVDMDPALDSVNDRLVWSRRAEDGWDLYEMLEGVPTPLYTEEGDQRKPQFSADGSTLVFEDDGGIGVVRGDRRITIAKAQGTEVSRRPRVSDDGSRIFWERFDQATMSTTLWMRDEDGKDRPLLAPSTGWSGYSISRNGQQLTYSAFSEEGEDLHVWHLDNGVREVISDKAAVARSSRR